MSTGTKWHPEGRGPSTPWGSAQYTKPFGRGIAECGTAGHGGIRVSRALAEREMHPAVRMHAIRQGGYYWFEEDCAYALVVLSFPDRFEEAMVEHAKSSAKNWFPGEYMMLTGVTSLRVEESYMLRKRDFEAKTREMFVVRSALGKPDGMVEVQARRASDGAEKTALVSKTDYDTRGEFGYVLAEAS